MDGLARSEAEALLVSHEIEPLLSNDRRPRLVVDNAHLALARILEELYPIQEFEPHVHATAIVAPRVRLGRGVRVGPYAVLEEGVVVEDGAWIGAHVVVGARSRIGSECILHPHVVLYPGTRLGRAVILHSGARVGVDGFGYVFDGGAHRKIPQVGGCQLDDGVEVGANTTIDRGSIGDTRIAEGTKLDNLVQIGHNVTIGSHCILAGQVGVGGSARIESGVLVGGQAGVAGHITLESGVRVAAQAGVTRSIPAAETVMGFPARTRGEFLRGIAAQGKGPELIRRVRSLERELAELKGEIRASESEEAAEESDTRDEA